jgi:hypothetical protein
VEKLPPGLGRKREKYLENRLVSSVSARGLNFGKIAFFAKIPIFSFAIVNDEKIVMF